MTVPVMTLARMQRIIKLKSGWRYGNEDFWTEWSPQWYWTLKYTADTNF